MTRRWKSGRKFTVTLIAILLSILLVETFWVFIVSPRLTIGKIFLESDIEISDEKLLEMLGLGGRTWTSLDERSVQRRLESYPIIREVRISRVFPDGLRVYIFRRQPMAAVLLGEDEVQRIAILDEEGYVIQAEGKINDIDLPILTWSFPYKPTLGSQVPETVRGVLSDLSRLKRDEPKLFDLISEIEFISHGEVGYDLKVYMNHIPIPVLVDMDLSPKSVRHALVVIDVLELTDFETIDEADIRGGHVVYRPAGRHGG